jgi:hypothetical protein
MCGFDYVVYTFIKHGNCFIGEVNFLRGIKNGKSIKNIGI